MAPCSIGGGRHEDDRDSPGDCAADCALGVSQSLVAAVNLAEQIQVAMQRQRALAAQRVAVGVVLAKYSEAPTVVGWARTVLASDEVRPYRLLFRVAERGVSC